MDKFSAETSTYRIIDAALNRASEGLRVVEDVARMHLNDRFLAQAAKNLRHAIVDALDSEQAAFGIIARETLVDVGRDTKTVSEFERVDFVSLVKANCGRVQQALRTIEEATKLIDATRSKKFESYRYESYVLEKSIVTSIQRGIEFDGVNLYVLVGQSGDDELLTLIQHLIEADVRLIQLRAKQVGDRPLIQLGKKITQLTRNTRTRWIMNDRPDLALVCQADGVHLGQEDMSVFDARRVLGPKAMVGVSTHNLEQARQAVRDGADYIGVGPVFPSRTKDFAEHVGLQLLRDIASEISLPAFAIGGIDATNLDSVLSAGFHRVAVSAAVEKSANPRSVAAELITGLSGGPRDAIGIRD